MHRVVTSETTATRMTELAETTRAPDPAARRGLRSLLRDRTAVRLFFTVWLIYTFHFASDVVRETYLSLALVEQRSVRVDEYLGLHPDLFAIEGRGAYINNNPGASFLGALPYAVAYPAIAAILRARPELAQPKPPTRYDDPRPNRNPFLTKARERGLDVKLGLAAASIHAGLMVPLAAIAALLVFLFLRERLRDEKKALWLALLYAFGTPVFFRSAFLNQNMLVAHFTLGAYLLAARLPRGGVVASIWIGVLLGMCVLCDYSGLSLALAFGVWLLVQGWRSGGVNQGLRWAAWCVLGALGPIALLMLYQYVAFGNPFLPAQAYMPPTPLSVMGWHGFIAPSLDLMWRNLFDPRYGLFAFSPMLLAAFAAPFVRRRPGGPTGAELALIFGAAAALYLFSCSVLFGSLQWNTGVRYMVPAAPLLFFALVPVLLRVPRWAAYAIVIPTVAISWSVAMTRMSVPVALADIFLRGFELPWLTVLRKTAEGYAPFLADGASPIAIFCLIGVVLWLVWRGYDGERVAVTR
jgi:hypothetical protein